MSNGQSRNLNSTEKIIQQKLAYEWKNVYRNLVAADENDSGCIDILDFDKQCLKFQVSFTKEELRRIAKSFSVDPNSDDIDNDYNRIVINYKRLSYFLGLHKSSFNYIAGGSTHGSTAHKIYKLK